MPANFFSNIPAELPSELIQTLIDNATVRIERIVSAGHRSQPDFWYDQEQNEWIIVLQGRAALEFAEPASEIILEPGDYLEIPAHQRHRVAWTCPQEVTLWLAVFYDGNAGTPVPSLRDTE